LEGCGVLVEVELDQVEEGVGTDTSRGKDGHDIWWWGGGRGRQRRKEERGEGVGGGGSKKKKTWIRVRGEEGLLIQRKSTELRYRPILQK